MTVIKCIICNKKFKKIKNAKTCSEKCSLFNFKYYFREYARKYMRKKRKLMTESEILKIKKSAAEYRLKNKEVFKEYQRIRWLKFKKQNTKKTGVLQ